MRIIWYIKETLDTYFDKNSQLGVHIFNALMFIGIFAGFAVAVVTAIFKINILAVIINSFNSLLCIALLDVANRFKRYRLCSWIAVILMFFIAFPALYYCCGGHKSGVGYLFIVAIAYSAILLKKRDRAIAVTLETMLYFSCLLTEYYRPETVFALASESHYFILSILKLSLACILLSIVLLIRTRIFEYQRKQIQELNRELLARSDALERYDRMKSDFLASVAHEINTPLAVIAASSSDTLDQLKESPLNIAEITENQIVIERRVKLIDKIVLDLMDTAAIENGRLTLRREPLYLAELIGGICDSQHKKLDTNDNELVYDLDPDLPRLWADPARIEQVMINLLTNAFKHTIKGTVKITLAQEGGYQTVSVSDDGAGMDEEMARVALKQYVSTKSEQWRHGIGLYVCRRIILAHGGDISLQSVKGKGTTISFALWGGEAI